ncbi:MAG: VOC family protein [Candidatus Omnitrophica bacterium]|nr:VOC family protein [Candidatus Omnitrophota bacterium]
MQKIVPCLWFDKKAEEAANFYVSVFKNSKVINITRYGKSASQASGQKEGSVMTVSFEIEKQEFLALNAGSNVSFTPAISLMVNCKTQKEIDELWEKLSADKQFEQCGWLTDKFGVTWQINPASINEMLKDKDMKKIDRMMAVLVQMKKLDIKRLEEAYNGKDK